MQSGWYDTWQIEQVATVKNYNDLSGKLLT